MKRLITINSYRGQRILLALPCRGQRTRTNASTVKRQLGKLRSRLKPRKLDLTCAFAHCIHSTFAFDPQGSKPLKGKMDANLLQRIKGSIKRQKGRSLIGKMSLSKPRYRIVPTSLH
jgi:hypothetical protein